jgi:hypothetical protein
MFSKYCYCGKTYGKYGRKSDQNYCSTPCNGNSRQHCGNILANSVYSVKSKSTILNTVYRYIDVYFKKLNFPFFYNKRGITFFELSGI